MHKKTLDTFTLFCYQSFEVYDISRESVVILSSSQEIIDRTRNQIKLIVEDEIKRRSKAV